MTGLLFDSGVVFAALDRSDRWHGPAVELMLEYRRPPRLPVTTLPEICYLARKMLGGAVERAFVADVADAAFVVEALSDADCVRAAELMGDYPAIGFVDATVVAIAERLEIATIATVDRRHFASVRPRHVKRFTLVP